jgi:hypothetical protein
LYLAGVFSILWRILVLSILWGDRVKKLFAVLVLLVLAIVFWFSFALWTGIYSVYSYPPSPAYPDGVTLIVSREDGEPTFNSPAVKIPPPKVEPKSGIGFGGTTHAKRPLEKRTIVELPYVEWAYDLSLETPSTEKTAP